MKKDTFFIYLANKGYLKYRAILLALFGVIEKNKTIIVIEHREIKDDIDSTLCTITEDNGLTFNVKDTSVKIDWYVPGEPLYTNKGTLTLNANDIPNLSERVETTYGRVLANQLLLLENNIKHIKFVNGNWINDKIIKKVMKKIAKDDSITSEQAHDFVNAIQFVSSLTQLFVPSASEKALTTDPRIPAKKKELLEKYKDKLGDPAIISKIEQELVAMDRAWLKGDISEGFYKSGKDFNVSRKRMFIMHGGEKSFIDDSKIDMIKFSLNEGWDLEELPKVANSLRDGSYGRGAATAMGGERVKKFQQAFQNSRISLTDCGSKRGGMFVITEDNKKDFIGRTNMKGELLTEDSLNQFIGETLEIRSPLYCLGDKTDYCEVCSGIKMGESPNIVNTLTAAVGSVFMLIEMKSTHGKELLTANFSLKKLFKLNLNEVLILKRSKDQTDQKAKDSSIVDTPKEDQTDQAAKDSGGVDTTKGEKKESVKENKEFPYKAMTDYGSTEKLKRRLVRITGIDVSNLNSDELNIASGITDYIAMMSPESKMTDREGADKQSLLFKTIISILRHDPNRFKNLFRWTIDVISSNRKKKGAFHDKYIMRYYSYMHLSSSDMKKFKSLMNIINITADIKNRKSVQAKTNINQVIERLKDPTEKTNLTNFYFS